MRSRTESSPGKVLKGRSLKFNERGLYFNGKAAVRRPSDTLL